MQNRTTLLALTFGILAITAGGQSLLGQATFYRAGEAIQQQEASPGVVEPTDNYTEPESPFDVLEEEVVEQPIEEPPVEFTEPEEEVVEEQFPIEEPEEEPTKPSASGIQSFIKIVNRLKYLVGAVLLAGLAFVHLFKRKKKVTASASPEMAKAASKGLESEQPVPGPEPAQQSGQQSERLKAALAAMGDEGKSYPHQPTDAPAEGAEDAPPTTPEPPKE